jgi:putative ABC transport system substrate-binding protein
VDVFTHAVHDTAGIERIINMFAAEPNGGLIPIASAVIAVQRDFVISLANRHHLPNVHAFRYYPASGGLASYGVDNIDLHQRAASYIDRILKGAKPADLPVEQSTKFEFVINLQTAKAFDLEVPPTLSARADEVIE